MKKLLVLPSVFFAVFWLGTCAAQKNYVKNSGTMDLTAEEPGTINDFAFDLHKELLKENKDKNMFYSPYSISSALAMCYEGSGGQTETEMAAVLKLGGQPKNYLMAKSFKNSDSFTLNIANALWGQTGYEFLPDYINTIKNDYSGHIEMLNFASSPEESRLGINAWISRNTNAKIEDLLAPGSIDRMTRLVLTNAVYFNATWLRPFNKQQTAKSDFWLKNGTKIETAMMHVTDFFSYARGKNYSLAELLYKEPEISMLILVPDSGSFDSFEKELDSNKLIEILNDLEPTRLKLSLPAFSATQDFSLAKILPAMGMKTAFSDKADFSGIDGSKSLYISDVVHKAYVKVDEDGTEAAAATAVIMARTSLIIEEPIELNINRPFIFIIRKVDSNSILFIGRIMNPEIK